MKGNYGITPEMYQLMCEDQSGKCYFCDHTPDESKGEKLAIDHDKDTTFVRGLLCSPCNASWVDLYAQLPEAFRDSPRTNDYLLRGKSGDYIESIRRRVAASQGSH